MKHKGAGNRGISPITYIRSVWWWPHKPSFFNPHACRVQWLVSLFCTGWWTSPRRWQERLCPSNVWRLWFSGCIFTHYSNWSCSGDGFTSFQRRFLYLAFTQLPHQQHAWRGAFPHQLPVSVLREPLPSHRAGGPQRGTLRGAGDQPTGGPDVQAPGDANTDGPGAGLRRSLPRLLAHTAQGEDRPVRVPRPTQRGADRVETFHPGCGKVDQGRAAKGAGETHSRHEAEGRAPPMFWQQQQKKVFVSSLTHSASHFTADSWCRTLSKGNSPAFLLIWSFFDVLDSS